MDRRKFLIRNEGLWALQNFKFNNKNENWEIFLRKLCETIEFYFDGRVTVESHDLQIIEKALKEESRGKKTISLDPCIEGDVTLGISRHFQAGGVIDTGLGARPGYPSLEDQVKNIPPGEYEILEDDIFTGGTMKKITELVSKLNPGVIFKKLVVGFQVGDPEVGMPVYSYRVYDKEHVIDINDPRDFLLGAHESGLVVIYPDGIIRVPYVYPFTDPHERSSIPKKNRIAFSKKIWEINCEFWQNYPEVLVKDTELRQITKVFGYDPEISILTFCQKMLILDFANIN